MTEREVEVINKLGLHARAAAKVVNTASRFAAEITIGTEQGMVNAKSILGLLTLAATKGTKLLVRAEGEDEVEAVEAIVSLFIAKFGEAE